MHIEVWFDLTCPFCYISKHRLSKALKEFPHKSLVSVEYKSLQLDPEAALYDGRNYYDSVTDKQRISMLRAKMFTDHINRQAQDLGLTFNYDDLKQTNTFDAHRLIKLASSKHKEKMMIENLFQAHFSNGKDLGDEASLIQIGTASGLQKNTLQKVLADKTMYAKELAQDRQDAEHKGVSGLPFIIINDTDTLEGAQPTIAISRMLQKAWSE